MSDESNGALQTATVVPALRLRTSVWSGKNASLGAVPATMIYTVRLGVGLPPRATDS